MAHGPSYDELQKRLQELKQEISERRAKQSACEREHTKLRVLCDLAVALTTGDRLDSKLQLVVEKIRELFKADIAVIALCDDTPAMVHVVHVSGNRSDGFHALRLPFGRGLCGNVVDPKQGYIIEDVTAIHPDTSSDVTHLIHTEGMVSGASVPMRMNGRDLGMIYAANRSPGEFPASDVNALVLIGNLAAAEISRWRTEELLEMTLGDLERLEIGRAPV